VKRLGLLAVFLYSLTCLYGQTPKEVTGVTYLPKTFYVGDVVEMRVELPGISPGEITVPPVLPPSDWFTYRQIEVQPVGEGSSLRILFSSYQPGIRLIPPVNLGALTLSGIRVDTASMLEREPGGLAGTADPLFLPQTGFYLAVFAGAFLGIPLILFVSIRLAQARIFRALQAARRRRPYQRILRVLKDLDRRILNRDGNYYYTTMTDELKLYLSSRSGEDFSTLTGREASLMVWHLYKDEPFLLSLQQLLLFAEEVKFGGRDPYTSKKREDLNSLLNILEGLEGFYHRTVFDPAGKEEALDVDR
jgi:hypothetical protein